MTARATPAWLVSEPTPRLRIVLALVVGVCGGLLAWYSLHRPGFDGDIEYPLRGARLVLQGIDPYAITRWDGRDLYGGAHLFYPPWTLVALLPLVWLPAPVAGGILFGTASAVLAYLLTRDGVWRAHVFLSGSFVIAASLAQWAPLLMIAALLPAAGVLWLLKPSVGLAAFAARPSWRTGIASAVIVAVVLLLVPRWVSEWLTSGAGSVQHIAPVRLWQWGGPLLLLAALRWRTPGGRLLLVLAVVPQFLFFYDQMLLWLVPRTRRESLALTMANQAGVVLWIAWSIFIGGAYQQLARPFVMLFCYLPALVLVLRQPNEGPVPAWLARPFRLRHPVAREAES